MSREASIHKVNPTSYTGVSYYRIFVSFEDTPNSLREVRFAHDAVYESRCEGDRVIVETLLT
jgi:hypothetical protein